MESSTHRDARSWGTNTSSKITTPTDWPYLAENLSEASVLARGMFNPEAKQYADRIKQAIKSGKLTAADIARVTIEAVKSDRFYILPHPNVKVAVEIRMKDILSDRAPTNTSPR